MQLGEARGGGAGPQRGIEPLELLIQYVARVVDGRRGEALDRAAQLLEIVEVEEPDARNAARRRLDVPRHREIEHCLAPTVFPESFGEPGGS